MATHNGTAIADDGSLIHYEICGTPSADSPSLVFLHYYGGSPSTWRPLLTQSPLADFHTVTYHARGWTPSTGPTEADAYGISAMANDLATVLSATGLQHSHGGFILVGHSMGAKVAQYYAGTAAPPRLKGLVLVAPAPLHGVELPTEAKQQQLAAYQSPESVEFVLHNVLTAGPDTLTEGVVARCVRDSLRGNEQAKKAWPEYAMGEDHGELMAKIDVPVLILRGDKDFERNMVGSLGTDLGWVNKNVENCGHLIPLEQPIRLQEEISAFVRKVS